MICPICETTEIRSNDPEADSCIDCQRTGRRFEFFLNAPVRSNLLGRIRETEGVLTANLWPSTPGCWQLGVTFVDGRLAVTGAAVEAEAGVYIVAPAIPPLGVEWLIGVQTPGELGYENGESEMIEETFDDDGLVEKIAELAR